MMVSMEIIANNYCQDRMEIKLRTVCVWPCVEITDFTILGEVLHNNYRSCNFAN